MKRKAVHKKPIHTTKTPHAKKLQRDEGKYMVLVRTWVFLVLFAIMLGVGAEVGQYINNQLNGSSPTVAGVSTDR